MAVKIRVYIDKYGRFYFRFFTDNKMLININQVFHKSPKYAKNFIEEEIFFKNSIRNPLTSDNDC